MTDSATDVAPQPLMAAGVYNVRTETLFNASAVTQENNIHSSPIAFKYTHVDHYGQMAAFTTFISAALQYTLEEIFFRIHNKWCLLD